MTDRKSTRRAAAALFCALGLAGGCTSGSENFNKAPTYEGPGCYDFKGRIERTITTSFECDRQGWVWRTEPRPAGPAGSQAK